LICNSRVLSRVSNDMHQTCFRCQRTWTWRP